MVQRAGVITASGTALERWQVIAASATGSAHLQADEPGQDAYAHAQRNGVLAAVVCDGAGSAACSAAGAQHVAEALVEALVSSAPSAHADVYGHVQAVLGHVRDGLQRLAESAGQPLDAYACTVVGAWLTAEGGVLLHIGDGVAVAEFGDAPAQVSWPENGEYANETVFITSPHWSAHLRVVVLEQAPDLLAVMSDGAMSFAMGKGRSGLFRPFIDPILAYLGKVDAGTGCKALVATLADPRTHTITNDDKTLLLAWPRVGAA